MLLPEDPLELLIEQLRRLPRRDRDAILSRLSAAERKQVLAQLRGSAAGNSSPWAPDIAARIAALETGTDPAEMTRPGCEALARAAGIVVPPAHGRGTASLLDSVGALLRPRGDRE